MVVSQEVPAAQQSSTQHPGTTQTSVGGASVRGKGVGTALVGRRTTVGGTDVGGTFVGTAVAAGIGVNGTMGDLVGSGVGSGLVGGASVGSGGRVGTAEGIAVAPVVGGTGVGGTGGRGFDTALSMDMDIASESNSDGVS